MSHAKRIAIRSFDSATQHALQKAGASPLLAQLYAARQVHSPDELRDDFRLLLPFHQLKNCTAAAARLADAIKKQEKILIIADYDADGATACAVGVQGLRAMGAVVDFFVPNRFEHGYGLTPELAEIARDLGADLILTVDNGISSHEGVARAKALGIDTVVTDHHVSGQMLPECIVVNPNQPDCSFPSKNLAGVGVIFYVLIALRAYLRERGFFDERLPEPKLDTLLDLVALGTVADVVPLDHNNRILVSQGLKRIRAGKMSHGIRALFQASRRDPKQAQPFDMGFGLGPRLNAAGRLDDMSVGIACLLATHLEQAQTIAESLNDLNHERQAIEQSMLQETLASYPDDLPAEQTTLVMYRPDFHQGVVGIVASRLKDKFYRPTFVFAPDNDGLLRGSGRSINGIHLRDVLDAIAKQNPDMIVKFGGHAMAAGLTLRENYLDEFCQCFERIVREWADESTLSQTFLTDGHLDFSQINIAQIQHINHQVWGQGFAPPSFTDTFDVLRQSSMGASKQHTKAWLSQNGQELEAIFWRFNSELPPRINMVYRPIINEWQGNSILQLHVDYWEAA